MWRKHEVEPTRESHNRVGEMRPFGSAVESSWRLSRMRCIPKGGLVMIGLCL